MKNERRFRMTWSLFPMLIAGVAAGLWFARSFPIPENTSVTLRTCVQDDGESACLTMPRVNGVNIEGEELVLPGFMQGELNLVIMPFDRDQQVGAAEWIPLFQELVADTPDAAYYSIAALPDLAAPIRLLVTGGMSVGMSDPDLRRASVVLFLSEQAAFTEALGVSETEAAQLFIFNESGEVLWRADGAFDEAAADALRLALDGLSSAS